MSPSFRITLSLLLCLAAFSILAFQYEKPLVTPDSPNYTEMATDILSGNLLVQEEKPTLSRAIRTPMYPLILAAGIAIFGFNSGFVLGIHLILGLLVLTCSALLLRRSVPILFTGGAFCFVAFVICGNPRYLVFPSVMTEWPALLFLLLFFALLYSFFERQRLTTVFALGLCISLAVLTRPSLQIMFITIFPILFLCRERILVSLGALFAGFLPIVAWMGVNAYTIGTFSITAFDGVNLFGVAALIGNAELHENDAEDLKYFITTINENKRPAVGTEDEYVREIMPYKQDVGYNWNIYELAVKDETISQMNPVRLNELMREYAKRSISTHLINYFIYIRHSLLRGVFGFVFPCLMTLLLSIACIRAGERGIGFSGLSILLLHALNLIISSMAQMVVYRYVLLTLAPVYFVAIICASTLLVQAKKSSR